MIKETVEMKQKELKNEILKMATKIEPKSYFYDNYLIFKQEKYLFDVKVKEILDETPCILYKIKVEENIEFISSKKSEVKNYISEYLRRINMNSYLKQKTLL